MTAKRLTGYRSPLLPTAAAVALLGASMSFGQQSGQIDRSLLVQGGPPAAPVGDAAGGADPQVLESGPIHEAYAAPIGVAGSAEQQPLEALVEEQPPDPIDELPPEQRPEGQNVQWIPGYWAWSPDQADFVWVSGVWRDTPPDRLWTPGSWIEVEGGYAWSPGFWVANQSTTVAYLPAPPATLEQGPSSPAPSEQHFWVPGCWVYQDYDYRWRAGYWYQSQPGWVWVPSYYNQTPRGYVYVNGYWDYPLARRGVLYAPVYWGNRGYVGYRYRPRSVIDTALLITSLYVNPSRNFYYYGAYGPRYRNAGYVSWYDNARRGPRYYDPLYHFYRHGGGRGADWKFADLERRYRGGGRPDWDGDRPRDGDRDGNRGRRGPRGDSLVAGSYDDLARRHPEFSDRRMRSLDRQAQNAVAANIERYRDFGGRRADLESRGDAASDAVRRGQQARDRALAGAEERLRGRGPRGDDRSAIADGNRPGRRGAPTAGPDQRRRTTLKLPTQESLDGPATDRTRRGDGPQANGDRPNRGNPNRDGQRTPGFDRRSTPDVSPRERSRGSRPDLGAPALEGRGRPGVEARPNRNAGPRQGAEGNRNVAPSQRGPGTQTTDQQRRPSIDRSGATPRTLNRSSRPQFTPPTRSSGQPQPSARPQFQRNGRPNVGAPSGRTGPRSVAPQGTRPSLGQPNVGRPNNATPQLNRGQQNRGSRPQFSPQSRGVPDTTRRSVGASRGSINAGPTITRAPAATLSRGSRPSLSPPPSFNRGRSSGPTRQAPTARSITASPPGGQRGFSRPPTRGPSPSPRGSVGNRGGGRSAPTNVRSLGGSRPGRGK